MAFFFTTTSLFVFKLEQFMLLFFVSVCIAQYTVYGIQYPADRIKFKRKITVLKRGKVLTKCLKSMVKSGITGLENFVQNLVEN